MEYSHDIVAHSFVNSFLESRISYRIYIKRVARTGATPKHGLFLSQLILNYMAGNLFPEIMERFPPEEAFRPIVLRMGATEQTARGMGPNPTLAEVRCYIRWLCRIERGSSTDAFTGPQKRVPDIDLKFDILRFYRLKKADEMNLETNPRSDSIETSLLEVCNRLLDAFGSLLAKAMLLEGSGL